jgi:hypothetical protein
LPPAENPIVVNKYYYYYYYYPEDEVQEGRLDAEAGLHFRLLNLSFVTLSAVLQLQQEDVVGRRQCLKHFLFSRPHQSYVIINRLSVDTRVFSKYSGLTL